jgi:Immunoglobulin V-set domain
VPNESAASSLSVDVGTDTLLPCNSNIGGTVSWLYIRFDTAEQSKICIDGSVVSPYKDKFHAMMDRASGNFSLVLLNAQTSDSGWYVCVVHSGRWVSDQHVLHVDIIHRTTGE